MTRAKKWNVIVIHEGRNAKHVNVKCIILSSSCLSLSVCFFYKLTFFLSTEMCQEHKSSEAGWEPAACSSFRHSETNTQLTLYTETCSCLQIKCQIFNAERTERLPHYAAAAVTAAAPTNVKSQKLKLTITISAISAEKNEGHVTLYADDYSIFVSNS